MEPVEEKVNLRGMRLTSRDLGYQEQDQVHSRTTEDASEAQPVWPAPSPFHLLVSAPGYGVQQNTLH